VSENVQDRERRYNQLEEHIDQLAKDGRINISDPFIHKYYPTLEQKELQLLRSLVIEISTKNKLYLRTLKDIAHQALSYEMDVYQIIDADFETGYDTIIRITREAIQEEV